MLYLATALSLFLLSLLTPHTRGIVYRSANTQVNIEEVLNRLEETEKPVVIGLIINNNSGHKLNFEEVDLSCGVISNNSSMPDTIPASSSTVVYIEKVT